MNTKLLSYYLSEAVKGNAEASYKAGKLMASEGTFNEVAVQMRYIEAAKAGFTEAQKELGALGLCGRLITSDATPHNCIIIIGIITNIIMQLCGLKKLRKTATLNVQSSLPR